MQKSAPKLIQILSHYSSQREANLHHIDLNYILAILVLEFQALSVYEDTQAEFGIRCLYISQGPFSHVAH